MSALEKLVRRCNEMDITEQLNWIGDASMPYQAQLELAALITEMEALRQERDALSKAVEYLASVFSNANTAEEFMPIVIKNLKIAGRDDIADGLVMSGFAASLKATK